MQLVYPGIPQDLPSVFSATQRRWASSRSKATRLRLRARSAPSPSARFTLPFRSRLPVHFADLPDEV